jgi:hypothetical protein
VFTARPWRQGLWATLAFMARTSALHPAAICGPDGDGQQSAGADQELPSWQGPCVADVEEFLESDVTRAPASKPPPAKGDGQDSLSTAVSRDARGQRDAGAAAQRDAAGVVSGGGGQGCLVLDVYVGEEGTTAIAGCDQMPAVGPGSPSGSSST